MKYNTLQSHLQLNLADKLCIFCLILNTTGTIWEDKGSTFIWKISIHTVRWMLDLHHDKEGKNIQHSSKLSRTSLHILQLLVVILFLQGMKVPFQQNQALDIYQEKEEREQRPGEPKKQNIPSSTTYGSKENIKAVPCQKKKNMEQAPSLQTSSCYRI